MADGFIAVSNTGPANVDTESLTVGANTVNRQRIEVAGAAASEIARVLNSDAAVGTTLYGLLVRLGGRVPPQYTNGSILQSIVSVTSAAAVKLPTTALANRRRLRITNLDDANTLYIGSSTVTADTTATGGEQVGPGKTVTLDLGDGVTLYGITASGITVNVSVLEFAE